MVDKKLFDAGETISLVLAILAKGLLIIVLAVLLASFFFDNPRQAQCESIGGRYDGRQCWYNGKKADVNQMVEDMLK